MGGPAALHLRHTLVLREDPTALRGSPGTGLWPSRGLGATLLSAPATFLGSLKAGLFPESSLVFTVARPHVETSRRAGCREPVGAGWGAQGSGQPP